MPENTSNGVAIGSLERAEGELQGTDRAQVVIEGVPDPELIERPRRRRFTAEYKLAISPTERMVPRAVAVMGAEADVGGRAATRRFLVALYWSAPAGSLVEIRFSVASGMGRRFRRVAAIERVVDAVAGLARWTDAYVGVIPRRRRGGRRDDLVEPAGVVWVDCDNGERIASA